MLPKKILEILTKNKFHRHKIQLLQELQKSDYDRRLAFCGVISNRVINLNFVFYICFMLNACIIQLSSWPS